MDNNSWRAAQGQMAQGQGGGGEALAMPNASNVVATTVMDNVDWRTQLLASSRKKIVNKIMDTLKRHLPFSGQEGLQELNKIAVRFEDKIYTAATSQSDYLRKISLKMLTMGTKSQNPMANSNTSKNPPDPALASSDSTAQTGNASDGDWQEEVYQKIKSMKEMYLDELNEIYMKIAVKLQQLESLPQQAKNDQLEKLKFFKLMLERFVQFLRLNKNDIQIGHKEKLGSVEKQILNINNSYRPRKPVPM